MSAAQAKRSAEGVAAMRFAGSFERDPAVRNPDCMAGAFISARHALPARIAPLRRLLLPAYRRAFPGSYEYHIARTRHLDDLLLAEVGAGAAQVVILGAGYDTRAYRYADELAGTIVFEVDHPDTSARKRAALERQGPPPGNVTFIALDFDTADLGAELAAAGYEEGRRTFFVWEGVCMFLEPAAVDATLAFVADRSGPSSSIAFDYVLRSVVAGDHTSYGAAQTARYLARGEEPWRFGIDFDEVEPYLAARGLALESNLGPDELQRRYLERTDGRLHGRVVGFHAIAHARRSA
ncbi:MAG: SAM-dependent methyltransferase [Solirubrobacterales bacterium]|nr:SAM-dependent methyltransferase [Solirubrobacterales bacterium]